MGGGLLNLYPGPGSSKLEVASVMCFNQMIPFNLILIGAEASIIQMDFSDKSDSTNLH